MRSIDRGDFASRMKQRGIRLMNGECRDEHNLYQAWRTPSASYEAVRTRLIADYPESAVNKLMHYYCGERKTLPPNVKGWQDLFGRIYADMQVHHLERGFHRALEVGGLKFGKDVLRYRFDWRAKCIDEIYPPEWEVCHATDMAIWFWVSPCREHHIRVEMAEIICLLYSMLIRNQGLDWGEGLLDGEKELLRPWNEGLASFVHGDDVDWGTNNIRDMKRLRSDGKTDVWTDDQWSEGLQVWDFINGSGSGLGGWIKPKL